MPQPTSSDVHVDAVLTNISVAYLQSQSQFIATQVFPIVAVEKQTDKYFTYTKNDWFRDEAKVRADSTESVGSGYGLSTATYSCDVFAIHKDVGDQTRANTDSPLNPDRDATQFVTQRLLVRREAQFQSDAFATGVWDTDVTPANLWSAYGTSDPITDIETGKRTILLNTGFLPNMLVCGYDVFRYLKHHPDIVDRYKHTTAESISEDMIARVLGVDMLKVAMSVKATNVEGETAAMSFGIDSQDALLCFVQPSPGLLAPSAGYTFVWRGLLGSTDGLRIKRFRMENLAADRIEGELALDNKIVAPDLGYFFNEATT
jgi:hypothetical protein